MNPDAGSGSEAFPGSDQCPPRVRGGFADQERFDHAAGFLPDTPKAGRDHPGIVKNQDIPGLEQGWEVGKLAVGYPSGPAVQYHQPGGAAFREWNLGNSVRGEFVMEIRGQHSVRAVGGLPWGGEWGFLGSDSTAWTWETP